ncbi:hypothetical protein HZU77_009200 [Neisseriaceae bacterium TC5R-5]|nr:hypothetical protein [Neisseriaceae bacterium TC5R-5]
MVKQVYICINEPDQAFLQRYQQDLRVDEHNYEHTLYELTWPSHGPYGQLQFRHTHHTFSIDGVMSLIGTSDQHYPEEGIDTWRIGAALRPNEQGETTHADALQHLYGLLATLTAAGWQHRINPTQARITGRDAMRYFIDHAGQHLPLTPDYQPSHEEWLQLPQPLKWSLYAHGVYLDISLNRELDQTGKLREPGVYHLGLSIQSAISHWRALFDDQDSADWLASYLAEKTEYAHKRQRSEARIAAENTYQIDQGYRNPDDTLFDDGLSTISTPPLPLSCPSGTLCPKSGYWQPTATDYTIWKLEALAKYPPRWLNEGDILPIFSPPDMRDKENTIRWQWKGEQLHPTAAPTTSNPLAVDDSLIPAAEQLPLITCKSGEPCPQTGYWQATSTNSRIWKLEALAKYPPTWVTAGQAMPTFSPLDMRDKESSILWQWKGERLQKPAPPPEENEQTNTVANHDPLAETVIKNDVEAATLVDITPEPAEEALPLITCKSSEPCPQTGYWQATSTNSRIWKLEALAKYPPTWVTAGQAMPTFSPLDMRDKESSILWQWKGEQLQKPAPSVLQPEENERVNTAASYNPLAETAIKADVEVANLVDIAPAPVEEALPFITCKSGEPCPQTGYWQVTSTDNRTWKLAALAKHPPAWVTEGQAMPTFSPPDMRDKESSILWQWAGNRPR